MRLLLPDLLKEWQEHASEIEAAISDRNFRAFTLAFRRGCRCFEKIKELLEKEKNLKDTLSKEEKEEVKAAVSRWDGITEKIKPWMGEVKEKLAQVETKRRNMRKLGKAYTYKANTTGVTLRVKAK
ncbi:MAG: hypothetical protein A2X49_09650 [Lentisphaerae bacterium GWF2_52_8]|nr:MAG: hypothetical protein A2X49_09650 [Lentisphaerae bacterium GWF2_52_8]